MHGCISVLEMSGLTLLLVFGFLQGAPLAWCVFGFSVPCCSPGTEGADDITL